MTTTTRCRGKQIKFRENVKNLKKKQRCHRQRQLCVCVCKFLPKTNRWWLLNSHNLYLSSQHSCHRERDNNNSSSSHRHMAAVSDRVDNCCPRIFPGQINTQTSPLHISSSEPSLCWLHNRKYFIMFCIMTPSLYLPLSLFSLLTLPPSAEAS